MSGLASSVLSDLYHLPKDRDLLPSEPEDSFLQPLSYTIYRTCYTPQSDEAWEALKRELSQTFHYAIAKSDSSSEIVQKLLSLSAGGEPPNKHKAWRRIFLLADEEVLVGEPDQPIKYDAHIKYVQSDFDTPNLTVKRREPIRFFGWMKMRTWSL
ncbi:hypothetical protein HBH98_095940 [Parastagonospora nodorum]|nr:hypothetical protein HBH52_202350 [Parastagonospora nodorum]KAH4002689.1 hypothetical protein HBI10_077280 [Parastagonospora nodorum]KAH4026042.1 hypothetical protein HBI13_073100 [Parastagonospora nodorum]KAH4062618.1 hypothetical protein HBH50_205610 [Parastagonospora nodorum]KAH4081173.1 hypothetical protein HBH48_201250 [Parastagonospora nodorum]